MSRETAERGMDIGLAEQDFLVGLSVDGSRSPLPVIPILSQI